ncbi:MAG: bacillithiol system redox-active protein YtxJ [Bacteroidota bacterium]
MFKKLFASNTEGSSWEALEAAPQLAEILEHSKSKPVLIFKHSTRCSISSMALSRLERQTETLQTAGIRLFLLNLIVHRNLSNQIEEDFAVRHESPQAILIQNGVVTYHASHSDIRAETILEQLNA